MNVKSMAIIVGAIHAGWVGSGNKSEDLLPPEYKDAIINVLESMTDGECNETMKRMVINMASEIKEVSAE